MKTTKNDILKLNMIKMRDKFAVKKQKTEEPTPGANPQTTTAMEVQEQSQLENIASQKQKPQPANSFDQERKKALAKRLEEFRLLKKDVMSKIVEKLASIPEDIKISETRVEEMRKSLHSYTNLLDTINSIDENSWNEENLSSELASAMRKTENARLEHIKLSAKLATLEREIRAAEDETSSSQSSILPEITSLSFSQLFKLGFIFFLPLMLVLLISALIVAFFLLITFRV